MRYLLLIHTPESHYETLTEAEAGQLMAGYHQAFEEMAAAGVHRGGERLQPVATATTVRVKNGDVTTTDGPFAETKEQFGGYALIEVENLDEAIRWAAKIPGASYGCVEVRPLWEMEGEEGAG
jgi:hypothetical protein